MNLNLCPGCMLPRPAAGLCPCGYAGQPNLPHQLPVGAVLDGKYLIGRALGQGGFGITYIAMDLHLGIRVAIKEHYPEALCATIYKLTAGVTPPQAMDRIAGEAAVRRGMAVKRSERTQSIALLRAELSQKSERPVSKKPLPEQPKPTPPKKHRKGKSKKAKGWIAAGLGILLSLAIIFGITLKQKERADAMQASKPAETAAAAPTQTALPTPVPTPVPTPMPIPTPPDITGIKDVSFYPSLTIEDTSDYGAYLKDILLPRYGLAALDELSYLLMDYAFDYDVQFQNTSGIVSAWIEDMDQDGAAELMTLNCNKENDLLLRAYGVVQGEIQELPAEGEPIINRIWIAPAISQSIVVSRRADSKYIVACIMEADGGTNVQCKAWRVKDGKLEQIVTVWGWTDGGSAEVRCPLAPDTIRAQLREEDLYWQRDIRDAQGEEYIEQAERMEKDLYEQLNKILESFGVKVVEEVVEGMPDGSDLTDYKLQPANGNTDEIKALLSQLDATRCWVDHTRVRRFLQIG